MASSMFQGDRGANTSSARHEASSPVPAFNRTKNATSPLRTLASSPIHGAGTLEHSDSDSDVQIRRPVGHAARRMLRTQQSPQQCLSPQSASNHEDDLYYATPTKTFEREAVPASSPPPSVPRSSLFVSPVRSEHDESESEMPSITADSKSRLATLVAEKRAERLAKEAEEEEQRSQHASSDLPEEILEHSQAPVNEDLERIMSDAVKPLRKASKKAVQEMHAETQRLARQQALAHQTKVRKKFTTHDLFARFNFRPQGGDNTGARMDGNSSTSSALNSDAAECTHRGPASTPPTSPPTPLDRQRALVDKGALSKLVPVREDSLASLAEPANSDSDEDRDLPGMAELLSSARTIDPDGEPKRKEEHASTWLLRENRVSKTASGHQHSDNSDDDLEIVNNVPSYLGIFERAKGVMKREQTDSKAIHTLKHLAHLGGDHAQTNRTRKGSDRPSINRQVLEAKLRIRAKEQARVQQAERVAELKAKGIELQTAEEREREQEAFENLLDKARQEAVKIRKAEKAAANGKSVNAEVNADATDDESEDDDYVDESGSDGEAIAAEAKSNGLIDDVADEDPDVEEDEDEDEDEEDQEHDQAGEEVEEHEDDIADSAAARVDDELPIGETHEDDGLTIPSIPRRAPRDRKPRISRVVVDDDDTDADEPVPRPHSAANGGENGNGEEDEDEEDPFAAFNIGGVKPGTSLMSPTQAFHATMQTPTQLTQQESLDALRYLVPPCSSSLPPLSPLLRMQTECGTVDSIVPQSQIPASQQVNLVWESQAPETPLTVSKRSHSEVTLDTPGWQPTQDDGLPANFQHTPVLGYANTMDSFSESQTQSTVRLRVSESPVPAPTETREKRRIVRGQRLQVESSDDDDDLAGPLHREEKDAFREMARKRREALSAAELAEAEREAKGMMDEQAEESEDEYAGLGGDDYVAPENEQDREMIDSSYIDVNERELAALYAERQRAADEAAANQLYKDLTTGALRRKQANAFDLDEDEDDVAVRRRQMRQREEARKRKILLQDENIAGLADGKKSKGKDAFLKAIADDDERDDDVLEWPDMDEAEHDDTPPDSQLPQQVRSHIEPLQEVNGNKRRLPDPAEDRPPAKLRRTTASAFRAPTSLLELKESVSFLLEEPNAAAVGASILDFSSDSETDEPEPENELLADDDREDIETELNRQNDGGYAPDISTMPPPRLPASMRRTAPAKPAVVDRLSLKRGLSAMDSATGRTAWAATSSGGFKVPSLLRRATTNTAFAANERGVTTSNGMSRQNSGVKMGGTKKSSLAYQARAEERKAIVEASTKKRAENTARIAQLRRASSSGFGRGLEGRFE